MQNNNNKTKQISHFIGGAFLGLVLFSQTASATSLVADYGTGENLFLKVDGVETSAWAGTIKLNVGGLQQIALCVDFFNSMNVHQTYGTNLGTPGQINNGGRVAWLLDYELPTLRGASQMAGLQLAIWDIVTDNGNGLSSGRIQASAKHMTDAAAATEAKALLSLSAGHSATNAVVYFNYNLTNCENVQTLMGATTPTNNGSSTPEPQTFAMLGAGGFAGLLLKLRRRK